ncbi:hypothetical protein [Allobaculum sp. JKK-2023]|uniref:hypothetical protein n=1 Tax=Allobaculum sp. JKK-2023 TaxID=3108943 RepID=UPI002B051DCF|nr:hypothetical protein [Allobaculum sp. JKK-2023]
MAKKGIVLEAQSELTTDQISTVEEIKEHLIKAQSLVDVIANSIEGKNKDNTLDLASELNSMVSVYDELDHAIEDAESVLDALKEDKKVDEKND